MSRRARPARVQRARTRYMPRNPRARTVCTKQSTAFLYWLCGREGGGRAARAWGRSTWRHGARDDGERAAARPRSNVRLVFAAALSPCRTGTRPACRRSPRSSHGIASPRIVTRGACGLRAGARHARSPPRSASARRRSPSRATPGRSSCVPTLNHKVGRSDRRIGQADRDRVRQRARLPFGSLVSPHHHRYPALSRSARLARFYGAAAMALGVLVCACCCGRVGVATGALLLLLEHGSADGVGHELH